MPLCRILPAFCLILSATTLWGQPSGPGAMRRQLQQRFESTSPAVGDRLPDVTLFDSEGKRFPLRQLKGHYTVLVFGCLT